MTQEDPAIRAELSALGRQGLAGYLREAGQVDRLLSLFRDDRRVARRFDPETGSWDGYQDDLDAAWGALDDRLAAEGDVTDSVSDLVRLALVRATLSSADDLPPAVVAAAVRTGTWTVQRAASTISRHPSSGRRAMMLSELLRAMNPDEVQRWPLTAQLAELAFLPSRDRPVEALLLGLDLLEPAARLAVADHITADAAVLPTGTPVAPITGPQVLPETAVCAIETVPEARRPAFLVKVADALLGNFTPSRRTRPEPDPGPWKSLLEVQLRDMGEAAFDPRPALTHAAELLARLAGFLPTLPAAQRLADRVAAVVSRVPDQAARGKLVAAFHSAFPARDIAWLMMEAPPEDSTVDDHTGRHDWVMGAILEHLRKGGRTADDDFGSSFSLDELNSIWLRAALPPSAEDIPQLSEDEQRQALFAEISRGAAPMLAGILAPMMGLADEDLYRYVREIADPQDLGQQFLAISLATESMDEASGMSTERSAAKHKAAARKVKAALLINALDHHFRRDTLRAAWLGILIPDQLADIDWDAVLAFVLTLPAEEQRDALHGVFGEQREAHHLVHGSRYDADAERIPRLAALRLVLPYLSDEQVGDAFADVIALSDPWVRRLALEMLAPRLDSAQVREALRMFEGGEDAREQGWLLIELARRLDSTDPSRSQITQWILGAIAAMRTGADLDIIASIPALRGAEPASVDDRALADDLTVEQVLAALQDMDDNNRTDALLAIARATSGPLPIKIVEEALRLPVLNAAGRYSPRCETISCLADRIPEEALAAAFAAAMELPHRVNTGDSQAWGYSWTHQHPRGSALYELAPRLRGELAEAAFAASRDLPWMAREDVLQRLAPHADVPLAAAMFDYSVAIHDQYLSLPDSERVPYPLEGTLVTEPIRHFKLNHEVHLAEMIAAIASRLDPARLRRAVTQALSLRGDGPRAWLPARLLPLLGEDQREPLLSRAVVAAMEFISQEPGRLDLVTDLLPYMSTEISRRREHLDRFLRQRFPNRQGLLTEKEFWHLAENDQQEYLNLTGADHLAEMHTLLNDRDQDGVRAILVTVMLSPLYAENMQQALAGMLTRAPLQARVNALANMKQILEPGAHARMVEMTLQQALHGEMEPMDRARRLAALLPHLDQPARDLMVAAASRLPGPRAEDERELRSAFVKLTLTEFGKPSTRDPRFDELRHSTTMHIIRRGMSDDDSDILRQRQAPRIQLLDALGPTLSESGVADAVQLVRALPNEMERAGGIAALLPVATGEPRRLLRVALVSLDSPFARWLVLFNSKETLRADEDPSLAEFARSTAEEFLEPREVVIFLLLLIEYAHDKRQEWINRALALANTLPVGDQLKILAIVAHYAKQDPDLARTVTAKVCALPTPTSVHDGWAMATRMSIDKSALTNTQLRQLRLAESAHLRAAARRGRPELLRTLAEKSAATTELTTSDGILDIARAVRDICVEWQWPSVSCRAPTARARQ